MSLDAGSCLLAAAAFLTAAGLPALFTIARLPRLADGGGTDHANGARPGSRRLMAAIAISMLWLGTTGIAAVVLPEPRQRWHMFAIVGALGATVAAVLFLTGIERLPGVVESKSVRLRRRVDAFLIASAVCMGGWIAVGILVNHAKPIVVLPLWNVLVVTPPCLATVGAFAFALVTVLRVGPPRLTVGLLSAGSVIAIGGAAGVVCALVYGTPTLVAVAGAAAASGVALMGLAGIRPLRGQLKVERVSRKPARHLAGLVVLSAFAMIVVQLGFAHVLDQIALIAGVATGSTLVLRQWIALHDADQLAMRLSEDEVSLRALAYTDPLTGVANRRELLRVLNDEAPGGGACVLLAVDLDGFKNVNDLRGHDVGDAVLAEVAHRLRRNLRDGDVAARMGGDEFAVLMWATLADATVAAHRLLAALAQPYQTPAGSVFVSASIGVAGCESANDVPQLLRNADLALRFAKSNGKDRVERYDVAYDEWLRRRTDIEHELRGAIERDEFGVAYQPIVEVATMRVVGIEALLRWEHPRLGAVPPDEFIPIAEDAGMIGQLDQWVLHRACRQLGRWRSDGHDVFLSVNISVRELHLVDYIAQVTDVLRAHRVPADRLVLEITEHAAAVDLDTLVAQLEALRARGVRIALDDFGAGYSSLGRLRWLPVDILKIDRSLVGDPSAPSRKAAPLVDVVVSLGKRLDLTVIAEGVAERAEFDVVRDSGATLIQGEMLGRAMPAERVEAMFSGTVAFDPDRSVPYQRFHDVGQLDSAREMRQS